MLAAIRRPVAAGLLLLAVYVGLSFVNSPRGFLGTDTGGKVATLKVMTERGAFDPDLGYWAEEWDPEGRLYPLALTSRIGDRWVNVTTLPALWLGWLLYGLGGYRAALLVPMAGSVAAAFAARALLLRLGSPPDRAWQGFWLVGLASPLAIYALDFWEHSLGVASLAWSVVLVMDATSNGRVRWLAAAGAGALAGAAATMRTEAFVYATVIGAVLALTMAVDRRWKGAIASGGAFAGAFLVVLASNAAFERAVVGQSIRGPRTARTATTIGTLPLSRLEEAGITTVGFGGGWGMALGFTVTVLLLVGGSQWARRRSRLLADASLTAVVGAYAAVFASGLQFVPGLAPASPVTAAGGHLSLGEGAVARRRARQVLAVALAAVPLVLIVHPLGGASPQWGSRYLLPTSLLLLVLGWIRLGGADRTVRWVVTGLSIAVTVFGLAWLAVRSHEVERAVASLERRPEPVIVSGLFHLAREGGATYGDRRWLTINPGADAATVAEVLDDAGVDTFAFVALAGSQPPDFPGFRPAGTSDLRLFEGADLRVTTWRRGS